MATALQERRGTKYVLQVLKDFKIMTVFRNILGRISRDVLYLFLYDLRVPKVAQDCPKLWEELKIFIT